MDILYLLIPFTAVLVLGILGVFAWALDRGQFDDLEQHGVQILQPDGEAFDADQTAGGGRAEKSIVELNTLNGASR